MKTGIFAIILFTAILVGLLCSGCASIAQPPSEMSVSDPAHRILPQSRSYYSFFDTVSSIYSYAGDSDVLFEERAEGVSSILWRYHQLFDIYHEYSGVNNLCSINLQAGGPPLEVEKELVDFLLYARELYELTGGEMNVMLGPVTGIWHELREAAVLDPGSSRLPTVDELRQAAQHCSFDLLEIDSENCTLRLTEPGASLDVGALGKGYAAEKAAEYLREAGAEGYVLDVGGTIRMIGTKPDGTGWVTGIRDPNQSDEKDIAVRVLLSNTACVTSGIYERYYTVDGLRYHHIIDKDTLFPAAYCSSLTVVAQSSAYADALSTALFCMPFEEGIKLAEALNDIEVLWIFSNGEMKCTPGFEALMLS